MHKQHVLGDQQNHQGVEQEVSNHHKAGCCNFVQTVSSHIALRRRDAVLDVLSNLVYIDLVVNKAHNGDLNYQGYHYPDGPIQIIHSIFKYLQPQEGEHCLEQPLQHIFGCHIKVVSIVCNFIELGGLLLRLFLLLLSIALVVGVKLWLVKHRLAHVNGHVHSWWLTLHVLARIWWCIHIKGRNLLHWHWLLRWLELRVGLVDLFLAWSSWRSWISLQRSWHYPWWLTLTHV